MTVSSVLSMKNASFVYILIFVKILNFMFMLVEHEKNCITSGLDSLSFAQVDLSGC